MSGQDHYTLRKDGSIVQSELAVCVYTETTGVIPGYDEIVELAMVLFSYTQHGINDIIDSYSGFREPSCPVSRSAYDAHGLSEQDLKGHQLDIKRIVYMIEQADFIISHSAFFNNKFLSAIIPNIGDKRCYCSMNDIHWAGSRNLKNLLKLHSIKTEKQDRALSYIKGLLLLLSKKNGTGEVYFKELTKGSYGSYCKLDHKDQ